MPGPGGKEVGRLSLKVLPDTSLFAKSLKAYAERVERQIQVQLPVDLDTGMARAQMKLLLLQLKAMAKAGRPTINADVDAAGAIAATAAARGASNAFDGANTNANLLARSVLVVLPLVLAVASAAAAIAPAFAAVVPLAGGLVGIVAAIALGWKQMKTVMQPVIDGFKEMRKPIGDVITKGLTGPFQKFAKGTLPIIEVGMKKFGRLVNLAIGDVLKFFNTGKGGGLLKDAFESIRDAMRPFAKLAKPLVEMFLQLSIAAGPALQMMGRGILNAVNQFNKFLATGKASGAITSAMRTLGQAIQGIGRFVAAIFPSLVAMFPAVAAAFTGIGAALTVVFQIFGKVGAFIGKYPTLFATIATAVTGGAIAFGILSAAVLVFNTAMKANILVKIITVLFAIGAAVVYAYKNFEGFRNVVNTVGSAIATAFSAIMGVVGPVVSFIGRHIKTIGTILAAVGLVVLGFVAPWAVVLAAVVGVVAIIVKHWSSIQAFFVTVFSAIIASVMVAWTFIKTIVMTSIAIITGIIRVQVMIWKTIFMLAFALIRAVIQVAWAVIKGIVRAGIAVVTAAIRGVMVIVGIFRAAFNAGRAVVSAVIGAIRAVVSAGIGVVLGAVRRVSAVAGLFRSAFNSAKSAVTSAAGNIISFVKGIPGKIKSALSFDLSGAGRKIIESFGRGIQAAGNAIYNKVKSIASKIKGLLPGSPIKWGPLTSWNRGGAGKRLMNLLAYGIGARERHVIRQVQHTARAMDQAWSVPSIAAGFQAGHDLSRMGATVTASVGAIVDHTVSPGAQEIVISNWATGRGTMAEVADDKIAAVEFLNATNERMGV